MPWCHSQQSLHANVIKPVKSYCTLHYKQISFYLTEYILVHNLVHGAVSLVFDTDSKLNTFTDKKLFYYHVFPACCKYKSSQMWSTNFGLSVICHDLNFKWSASGNRLPILYIHVLVQYYTYKCTVLAVNNLFMPLLNCLAFTNLIKCAYSYFLHTWAYSVQYTLLISFFCIIVRFGMKGRCLTFFKLDRIQSEIDRYLQKIYFDFFARYLKCSIFWAFAFIIAKVILYDQNSVSKKSSKKVIDREQRKNVQNAKFS